MPLRQFMCVYNVTKQYYKSSKCTSFFVVKLRLCHTPNWGVKERFQTTDPYGDGCSYAVPSIKVGNNG